MDAIILDIEGLFQTSLLFLKQCVSNRLKEIAIPELLAATVNYEIRKVSSDIRGLKITTSATKVLQFKV